MRTVKTSTYRTQGWKGKMKENNELSVIVRDSGLESAEGKAPREKWQIDKVCDGYVSSKSRRVSNKVLAYYVKSAFRVILQLEYPEDLRNAWLSDFANGVERWKEMEDTS